MDLHSPQIQGFFKIPVDHLYAGPVLTAYFRKQNIPDLVVASPDVGFAKNAQRYADLMKAPLIIGNKTRPDHEERAEILDVIGDVEGKNVLIVDDFTISGGTLIEMAHACKARGARDIYACVSHGVFSKGSAEKIRRSPIKELVLTDTIGHWPEPLAPNCRRISVARLFAEAILSIHRRESVSRLFDSEVEPEIIEDATTSPSRPLGGPARAADRPALTRPGGLPSMTSGPSAVPSRTAIAPPSRPRRRSTDGSPIDPGPWAS